MSLWAEINRNDFDTLIQEVDNNLNNNAFKTTVDKKDYDLKNAKKFLVKITTQKLSKKDTRQLYHEINCILL